MPSFNSLTRSRGKPSLVWALCTVARSGSSWLSELASSTNCLGYPEEYLLDWRRQCEQWGMSSQTSQEDYLALLMRSRVTPDGVFAIKGSVGELRPFFELFPHAPCVWLTRENKLEQAVSWYRAHHGNLWTRRTGVEAKPQPLEFSADDILAFYDEIQRREASWHEFFLARRSPPLLLTYEKVCADPLGAVRSIAVHIGMSPANIERVESPLQVVRDELTATWVALVMRTHGWQCRTVDGWGRGQGGPSDCRACDADAASRNT